MFCYWEPKVVDTAYHRVEDTASYAVMIRVYAQHGGLHEVIGTAFYSIGKRVSAQRSTRGTKLNSGAMIQGTCCGTRFGTRVCKAKLGKGRKVA